jgi:hypothetical protein
MTDNELLFIINSKQYMNSRTLETPYFALRAVVELHKPYDSQDTPHEVAMGWCKGCSIEYSINEYASQPYPCPTIQAIEKELV